jgi:hypothetical protein
MSDEKTEVITEPRQGVVRAHQPGQAVFKSVLPENIDWKPFALSHLRCAWRWLSVTYVGQASREPQLAL